MRRLWGPVAVATVLAGGAPARAAEPPGLGTKPFTLTAEPRAKKPNLAVDDAGVGHFVWDIDRPYPQVDETQYCRVPRGATACEKLTVLPLPLEAFGEPQVLTPEPGQVIVVAHRCCGPGEGTYAVVSSDGGTTFAAPRLIGTVEPGQAVYGPGTGAVSLVDDVVTAGIHFQAAPLDGYTEANANVGNGPGLQGYDGSVGMLGDGTVPLVAFDDLKTGFFRLWSGTGDVNDLATWGPQQTIGNVTELRMASGIKGVVLMAKDAVKPGSTDKVFTGRRFDTTTNAFGPPVAISNPAIEPDVIFRDIAEDGGGNVAAAFIANGVHGKHEDPIRYRASIDGGKTWLPERTLVDSTSDTGFNLQLGAAPDGGGFLAYDANSVGPLKAVAIPPISAGGGSGGAGGSPGGSCPGQVAFGDVQAIAKAGCLKKQADGSYTSSDTVRLNGVDLVPHAGGRVVVDPVHQKVHVDDGDVKAGPVVLDKGSFDWGVGGAGPITTFTHLEKFGVQIFGFPVAGEATLSFDKNGAFIPAHLELPAVFGGITGDVTLRLKNPGGLKLDGFKIHIGDAFLGALEIKPLDVEYKGSTPPVFEGSATMLLPPAYSDPGAHVSFGFVNGKFKHAEGSVPFDPPLAIVPPWAYLRQIGLALSTDPLQIAGGVELIGGPQILGTSAVTIDALPPQGFSFTFSDPAILRISGSMKVVDVPFAHGFVELRTSGLFKFGGGLDFTVPLDLASVTAGIPEGPPLGPGFVDLSDGRFNAPFAGDVCVPAGCGFIDIGAQGVVSSKGIAVCGQYLITKDPEIGVSAGFGYTWGGDADVFGSIGGCDVTPYAVSAPARAAGPVPVTVGAGLDQENIVVAGTGGAPRITVTAPGGETVSSGAGGEPGKSTHMVVFSNPKSSSTTVLIGKPGAGTYTVAAQPGSPPIARVGHADGLPEPAVTAKVTGSGHRRRLAYTVQPIAGQTVRFLERADGAGADLGAAKGASGTLAFAPAPGPQGARQVVALVEQNGVPRREIVVANYTAPPPARPGRPRFVRAKRAGAKVRVTWGKAARAARYVVRVRLHDGTSRLYVVPGKRRSLTLPGVATRTFGSITVAGLTATSAKPGPARKAGVRKKARRRHRRRG